MKKKLFWAVVIICLITACRAPVEESTEAPPPVGEAVTNTPSPDLSSDEPAATDAAVAETAVSEPEPVETMAVEPTETTVPETEPAAVEPVTIAEAIVIRETDWVKGADEPQIIIIEYGDFQ